MYKIATHFNFSGVVGTQRYFYSCNKYNKSGPASTNTFIDFLKKPCDPEVCNALNRQIRGQGIRTDMKQEPQVNNVIKIINKSWVAIP